MSFRDEPLRRAQAYAAAHGLALGEELGFGVHGIVFVAENQGEKRGAAVRSAVKAHQREVDYARERDVYLRLRDRGVRAVRGCHVPRLLRYDDSVWVLEMTVVGRPYVLDFAGAHLDQPLDFSDEVMADWFAAKQEQFGQHWGEAQAIMRVLETYGIFLEDVNPNNIALN